MADDKKADDKKSQPPTKKADPAQNTGAGNVKLIGIAGLVKGEQFSVELGRSVVVGRSRECDICLRDIPAAREIVEKGGNLEEHFRTVSRKHLQITYIAANKVELKDLSSNGTYLDGKRLDGPVVVEDLVLKPHELKLGTTETFCLDWWRLVKRSEVPMVKVKTKAKEGEDDEDGEDDKKSGKDGGKSKSGDKPKAKDAKAK